MRRKTAINTNEGQNLNNQSQSEREITKSSKLQSSKKNINTISQQKIGKVVNNFKQITKNRLLK
jgi:hypothetical protein